MEGTRARRKLSIGDSTVGQEVTNSHRSTVLSVSSAASARWVSSTNQSIELESAALLVRGEADLGKSTWFTVPCRRAEKGPGLQPLLTSGSSPRRNSRSQECTNPCYRYWRVRPATIATANGAADRLRDGEDRRGARPLWAHRLPCYGSTALKRAESGVPFGKTRGEGVERGMLWLFVSLAVGVVVAVAGFLLAIS